VARKRANPFHGEWRIVSTDVWKPNELDDLGPAHITFGPGRVGELQFIAISASIDYRVGTRDGSPIAEFSWEGDDDGSPISGRGWARRTAEGLAGRLFIHQGDETGFAATRPKKTPLNMSRRGGRLTQARGPGNRGRPIRTRPGCSTTNDPLNCSPRRRINSSVAADTLWRAGKRISTTPGDVSALA